MKEMILPDPTQLHDRYKAAKPFEHIVLHDVLLIEDINIVLAQWPIDDEWDTAFNEGQQRGKRQRFLNQPFKTAAVLSKFLSTEFVTFLSELTGYEGLMSDSTWKGGGLSDTRMGAHLGIHRDFNKHNGLERAINVLVFLNRDWQSEHGGELELWSEERCEIVIPPIINTMVIFTAMLNNAWHGHRIHKRLSSRKSIAAYYYLPNNPLTKSHSTIWLSPNK